MELSELCRETRNQLFERGWAQGTVRNAGGNVCIMGAAIAALGLDAAMDPRYFGAEKVRMLLAFDGLVADVAKTNDAPEFNDSVETTFTAVIDTLDLAEKRAMLTEEGVAL